MNFDKEKGREREREGKEQRENVLEIVSFGLLLFWDGMALCVSFHFMDDERKKPRGRRKGRSRRREETCKKLNTKIYIKKQKEGLLFLTSDNNVSWPPPSSSFLVPLLYIFNFL